MLFMTLLCVFCGFECLLFALYWLVAPLVFSGRCGLLVWCVLLLVLGDCGLLFA